MSQPLRPEQLSDVFDSEIRTVVFPPAVASDTPTFAVVAGQPGSRRSMLGATVAQQIGPDAVNIRAEDLGAFHPQYFEILRQRPFEASSLLSDAVATWIGQSIAHARSTSRSVVLEGSFPSTAAVAAIVSSFATSGFRTQITIAASRRSESLLACASSYLSQQRAGRPARFTSRETHERGWADTRALAAAVASFEDLDRADVVGHNGSVLLNAQRGDKAPPFADVDASVTSVDRGPWAPQAASAWFGELRRATDYARAAGELSPPIADVLLQLHVFGLNDVLPNMPLRPDSPVVAEQERRLAAEIGELRRYASPAREREVPGAEPAFGPGVEQSGPAGPSR